MREAMGMPLDSQVFLDRIGGDRCGTHRVPLRGRRRMRQRRAAGSEAMRRK
jgi:hypothetical protein